MKKETIGILFVCMTLIVGGMFALWITTAPANGDDWTYLDPIVEDANLTAIINHRGNASVIPVWIWEGAPYDYIMTVRNNSDLLDNFDRIYLVAYNYEFPRSERDDDTQTIKAWSTREIRFYFVASEGSITVHSWAIKVRMTDVSASGGYFYWDVETNADQTTYTFHYPKIIGWEDP